MVGSIGAAVAGMPRSSGRGFALCPVAGLLMFVAVMTVILVGERRARRDPTPLEARGTKSCFFLLSLPVGGIVWLVALVLVC